MTENIKELLTLAAKACGYTTGPHTQKSWAVCVGGKEWAPQDNDGDCFRMETALNLSPIWDTGVTRLGVGVENPPLSVGAFEAYADHNGDKNAARRLASLRVAAELGRRMV